MLRVLEMPERIHAYLRGAASRNRDTERIGPFLATFTRRSENPYLNYAIPDDGAVPTDDDVRALIAGFERRERKPRLEFIPGLAPEVEPLLLARGFRVEGRLPLMTCTTERLVDAASPAGIEAIVPETDADFAGVVVVTHEAYGEPLTSQEAVRTEAAARRALVGEGGYVVLARDIRSRQPAGAGMCDVPRDGVSELAAVAVSEAFRRRGVAASVTARLARDAFSGGVRLLWLTPLQDEGERIYGRVGFVAAGEVLHISR
jgi:GNAT superfamily N-acetyltransferase